MPRTVTVCITTGNHRARVLARRDALVVEHLHLVAPIAGTIRRTLPPCFDLDEMIAVGQFALVRAATRYRPAEHDGTPFDAYARAAIAGAIKDTFRRKKWQELTACGLDETGAERRDSEGDGDRRTPSPRENAVLEFPAPAIEARIDLARRFASLRNLITTCLTSREAAVVDLYYSPAMPDLPAVARELGITRAMAEKAHASAIRTLRARFDEAA